MNNSMEDYLKIVTPHLHTDLVSPQALSHLQTLAQMLPPFFYDTGFECRLGANSSPVDLVIYLPQQRLNLPAQLLIHPVWQTLQGFYSEWVNPTSFFSKQLKNIGLEFDVDGPPSQIPIPILFFI